MGFSLQQLITSERYLRLLDAYHRGDFLARHAIIEEAIAGTEGAERAQWILMRAGLRVSALPVPQMELVRSDIDTALAEAPGDPHVLAVAADLVVGVVVNSEQTSKLGDWWRQIPTVFRLSEDKWHFSYGLGIHAWKRQRLRWALRHFDRMLAEVATWSPERAAAFSGRHFLCLSFRALVTAELGDLETAERDIAQAEERYQYVNQLRVSDRPLVLARANLALARGETRGARQALQAVWVREREEKYTRDPLNLKAEMDVVAGRIALAEGNRQGFDHFTGRALALAEQHKLAFTARRIRAIQQQALEQHRLHSLRFTGQHSLVEWGNGGDSC